MVFPYGYEPVLVQPIIMVSKPCWNNIFLSKTFYFTQNYDKKIKMYNFFRMVMLGQKHQKSAVFNLSPTWGTCIPHPRGASSYTPPLSKLSTPNRPQPLSTTTKCHPYPHRVNRWVIMVVVQVQVSTTLSQNQGKLLFPQETMINLSTTTTKTWVMSPNMAGKWCLLVIIHMFLSLIFRSGAKIMNRIHHRRHLYNDKFQAPGLLCQIFILGHLHH